MCRDGNTRNKNADPTNAHGSVGLVSHIVNICDSIEISFVRNNCDLTMELDTGAIYSQQCHEAQIQLLPCVTPQLVSSSVQHARNLQQHFYHISYCALSTYLCLFCILSFSIRSC